MQRSGATRVSTKRQASRPRAARGAPRRAAALEKRFSSRRTPAHPDLAVADDVAHFAGAAVEDFPGLQSDPRSAVADRYAYATFAAAARVDAPRIDPGRSSEGH